MGETLRLKNVVIKLITRIIQLLWHGLLYPIYHGPGEKVPPTENQILLDSATVLAYKIRKKKLTSVEVVNSFIERIKETNKFLNAVVEFRFEEALEDAKRADEYVANSGKTAEEIAEEFPFLGVPFTVKDSIAVKGMKHTAGYYLRKDYIAEEDADAVKLLRQAGGIPLATTNVPELCLSMETYNAIYGRTNNPFNTNRTCGGSSGGEAANLAVGGSAMGIGSDVGGSIRIPACLNGIFGHKPSAGVVSFKGQFPSSENDTVRKLITVGPLSRFATDLLPMMKVITTPTGRNILNLDQKVDISKLNVFYAEDNDGLVCTPVHPEIKQFMRFVLSFLKKTHGIQPKKMRPAALRGGLTMWLTKMMQCNSLSDDLGVKKGNFPLIVELIKTMIGISQNTFPVLALTLAQQNFTDSVNSIEKRVSSKIDQLYYELQELLGTNGVLIYPTLPTLADYHLETYVKTANVSYTCIFNVLMMPATHCPLGLTKDGLPVGIQVIAAQNQDRLTLAMAEELERAFGGWVPPSGTR